jgi:hypothetical protein
LSSGLHSLVDVGSLCGLDGLLALCDLRFRSRLDVGFFGIVIGVGILSLDCLLSSGLLRWGSLSFFIVGIGLLATALLGSGLGGRGAGSVFASSFSGSGSLDEQSAIGRYNGMREVMTSSSAFFFFDFLGPVPDLPGTLYSGSPFQSSMSTVP